MNQRWGCICSDCFKPYGTEQWSAPFLCGPCAYRQIQADRYLSWLRVREVA